MSYRPYEEYDGNPPRELLINSKPKKKWLLSLILLTFFLILAIVVFLYSPFSKINKINISETELVSEELILQATRVIPGDSFLKVNTGKIEETIVKLRPVKDVEATFIFPGVLEIKVVEKEVVGYIYQENHTLLPLLEDGTILTAQQSFVRSRPLIGNTNESNIYKIANQLKDIPIPVMISLSEISVKDSSEVIVYTKDGYELHIPLNQLKDKLLLYKDIMEDLEHIENDEGVIYMSDAIWYISYEDFKKDVEEKNKENSN
ncbi:hypothetical protein BHU72_07710 [Desulfuribacillus stibiiarsenatis]|uniref:POTRA domain-containing protein n=1 Tax=Desulfuribacillus stibiiarsenatis TaxID=1390249 RepID=A0A1E5L3P4_9FIRM|nr:FtsQ-type POTRA domain-containing protein [Desulfuribacillus stibiiarsenatis]OEH84714.1 hypothetical protein BHU72_07710 [Desulfuribacillus stibiiarsenatis]